MITFVNGDLFCSSMSTIVNTVNCVGVMGKGIAKQFKEMYPWMYENYVFLCREHQVKPGIPYPYEVTPFLTVINFPTKNHWRDPSKIEWIQMGLNIFVDAYKQWEIKSIAFPALGCNNGNLRWDIVKPLMTEVLSKIDIPVEIYNPIE